MPKPRPKKPTSLAAPPPPAYPKVIETYCEPWLRDVGQAAPSAFNGEVRIRRYRITVELIDEPIEVLRDRLRKLWREEEWNHHRRESMRRMAQRLGMDPNELDTNEHGKAVRELATQPHAQMAKTKRCGIPAMSLSPCDLEWGHDGDMHESRCDGFYADQHLDEHRRRQKERRRRCVAALTTNTTAPERRTKG